MAETAVERAADLARYAERSAIGVRDEHHLIVLPVIRPEQPFAGAIVRHLRFDDLGTPHDEALCHPAAHRLGKVGHRIEIGFAAMIEPMEQLLRPQLCLLGVEACFLQRAFDLWARQAHQVGAPIFTGRHRARHGHRVNDAGDRHGHMPGPFGLGRWQSRMPSTCAIKS